MAFPRLPQAKAEVSGAIDKNPGRFADRKTPKRLRPVGEPYAKMTDEQKWWWADYKSNIPWLDSSDRFLLRLACILTAKIDEGDTAIATIQQLSAILSKLGATPADKTKVNHADGDGEEPEDQFFDRPN